MAPDAHRPSRRIASPIPRRCRLFVFACAALLFGMQVAHAQLPNLEPAAKQLLGSVVTVRVRFTGERAAGKPAAGENQSRIVVCSGVVVDREWVVAPVFAGADSNVRITLSSGMQAAGRVRLIDEYSGLAMIRLDTAVDQPLSLATTIPPVGGWVLSAAAWGAEKPVISLGIISGHDRTDPGLSYPPLLQCDLRAAKTSGGAAVVDRKGALVGVVVVTGTDQEAGFSFAVPVDHVRRLLRVVKASKPATAIVVLKRRRPEVGMVLDGQRDAVHVVRVTPGSPAGRAGIVIGDRVIAVNGVHIRSVYQAVRPVLVRQPGDVVTFTIERKGTAREVSVTLGGGVELPRGRLGEIAQFVQPKVELRQSDLPIAKQIRPGGVQEVAAGEQDLPTIESQQLALLEKSLRRYQAALRAMQERLKQSENERQELQQQVDSLVQQFQSLKKASR